MFYWVSNSNDGYAVKELSHRGITVLATYDTKDEALQVKTALNMGWTLTESHLIVGATNRAASIQLVMPV